MNSALLSLKSNKNTIFNALKKSYIFIILAIIYIPLIVIVLLSFNGQTDRGNVNLNFGVLSIENYVQLFTNDDFLNGLVNTLIVLVCVVPISVVIATITCFGIWRSKSNLGKAILGISNVSLATPDAITAISLSLLFASTWTALGFDLGLFTVILAHISFCVPYAIIAIYPRMIKMNKNLILASYDLGYGKFKTFFKVIVPYLLPSILAACAIAAAMSLDDFVITNLVNGSSQTISTAIYTTRKGIKAWVVTFGAIMIMASILSVFIVSIVKIIKEKRGINNEKK